MEITKEWYTKMKRAFEKALAINREYADIADSLDGGFCRDLVRQYKGPVHLNESMCKTEEGADFVEKIGEERLAQLRSEITAPELYDKNYDLWRELLNAAECSYTYQEFLKSYNTWLSL